MCGILGEYHVGKSVDYQRFKETLYITIKRELTIKRECNG
jgi:hypothetical protein